MACGHSLEARMGSSGKEVRTRSDTPAEGIRRSRSANFPSHNFSVNHHGRRRIGANPILGSQIRPTVDLDARVASAIGEYVATIKNETQRQKVRAAHVSPSATEERK